MTVSLGDADVIRAWHLVSHEATKVVDSRLWKTQLLLHLHRHEPDQLNNFQTLQEEAERAAARLEASARHILEEFHELLGRTFSLERAHLEPVDSKRAQAIHEHCHYLGSARPEGLHLGLVSDREGDHATLLAVATLSPFDLRHITSQLPPGLLPGEILVLSRQVTFPWSPRNTATFTLSRIRRYLRESRPGVRMLFTFLDPNLGFSGATYRADNWARLGREHKKRYLYVDGNYVTDRHLIRTYGSAAWEKLAPILGCRLDRSRPPLAPLVLYGCFLDPSLSAKVASHPTWEVQPPNELVGN